MPDWDRTSTAGVALRGRKVFIARRKPGGDLGGLWEFPGGKVDPGETPRQGLEREMQEEFDLAVETGELLCRGRFEHGGLRFRLLAFEMSFPGEPPVLAEHTEYRWVDPSELLSFDFAPSDRVVIDHLQGKDDR